MLPSPCYTVGLKNSPFFKQTKVKPICPHSCRSVSSDQRPVFPCQCFRCWAADFSLALMCRCVNNGIFSFGECSRKTTAMKSPHDSLHLKHQILMRPIQQPLCSDQGLAVDISAVLITLSQEFDILHCPHPGSEYVFLCFAMMQRTAVLDTRNGNVAATVKMGNPNLHVKRSRHNSFCMLKQLLTNDIKVMPLNWAFNCQPCTPEPI